MIKKHLAPLLCLLAAGLVPAPGQNAQHPFNDPSAPMEKRIDNLLSLMTVEEKVACLGTNTGVPRLDVKSYGNSEGIHGVVHERASWQAPAYHNHTVSAAAGDG